MINLVKRNIDKAKAGDSEAAKKLIIEFCATVKKNRDHNGNPHTKAMGAEIHNHTLINEDLLDYLAECFNLILSGKGEGRVQADVALNLSIKGTRGNKTLASTRQNQLLRGMQAWEAYKLISGKNDMPKAQSRNLQPALEAAFEKIIAYEKEITKQTISIHTVEKAYKEWVKLFDNMGT